MWKKKKISLIIISSLLLLLSISSVSASLDNSILSAWNFDENNGTVAYDSASNKNLVLSSSGWNTGIINSAYQGTTGRSASITDSTFQFNTSGNRIFSVSLWFRPANITSGFQGIISTERNSNNNGWSLRTDSGSSNVYFRYFDGTAKDITATSLSNNVWYHAVFGYNGSHSFLYINNVSIGTQSFSAGTMVSSGNLAIGAYRGDDLSNNNWVGRVDAVQIWNRSLTIQEINDLYNNGTGLQYPFNIASINFTVTINDAWNNAPVNNVTLTLLNSTIFTNTTGNIIYTNIPSNSTELYNYTIIGPLTYFINNFTNVNVSNNANDKLWKKYNLIVNNFTNVINFNNTNYTRNLIANINITCDTIGTTRLLIYANNNLTTNNNVVCNGKDTSSIQQFTYTHSLEGNFTIQYELNASQDFAINNVNSSVYSFVSDLNPPVISVLNFTTSEGFGSVTNTFSMRCFDTIFGILTYNMTFENNNIFFGNLTNNTLQTNTTNTIYNTGSQTLTGKCSDLFSTTTSNLTKIIYTNNITLIDEQDNALFSIANITGARVYYDDNQTFFDFKANNTNNVFFSSSITSKLRFEFTYSNGDIINRWIDVSLLDSSQLRVCVFKDNNIQWYQQLLSSTTQQSVAIKNVFSNCYIANDFTRFAFQDAKILNAYTINSLYYLYTYKTGVPIQLASIDGSQQSSINLDVLEFTGNEFDIRILRPIVAVNFFDNQTMKIVYYNPANDSTSSVISITNLDTNTVVFSQNLMDPNALILYFDYSTLNGTYNVTSLFSVKVISQSPKGERTTSLFFNLRGQTGTISSQLAVVLSIMLIFFGLTMLRPSYTLSWFGLFIIFISMGILGSTVPTTTVLLLQGVNGVIMLFILVTMFTGRTEVEILQ